MVHETLPRERERPSSPGERALGLPQSTALIVGSIIGVGIFSLPYSLAAYGPISLLAMALTTVGAVALALMFAVLSRRLPADGGPYAYARAAFGNGVGFANAWSYWITAWAGNAAIVVGWVFYVEHFVNKDSAPGWSILIALVGLWVPAAVNLTGVRNMGQFQVVTTILKFLPLALMSTVGLFFIRTGTSPRGTSAATRTCRRSAGRWRSACSATSVSRRQPWPPPRCGTLSATSHGRPCWARSPARWSTCCRWSRSSASCPTSELARADNKASYSVAFNQIVGGGTWSGDLVAVAVIISGLGALNGWTMICAEMPLAAARDGLFPPSFARLSSRRVPAFGIIVIHGAGLGRHDHQLHGRQRLHGVHHPGADDRHHRRGALRLLGAGAAAVALDRPPPRALRTRCGSTSSSPPSRCCSRSCSSTTRATPATPGTSRGDRS